MATILDRTLDLGKRHPHGSNIAHKLADSDVLADAAKTATITEIAANYLLWRDAAMSATLPTDDLATELHVTTQADLFEQHRNKLDDVSVDSFDSRGALQSSALEEFCYFLFKPFLDDCEARKTIEIRAREGDPTRSVSIAVGHQDVFHGLYFTARSFSHLLELPPPQYPLVNIDFFIGKEVRSTIESDVDGTATTVFIPAIAIECKTYVDRPRWGAADNSAAAMKAGFPRCKYILLSEFLKLDLDTVNVIGSRVDHFYVLRRQKNIDRRTRRQRNLELPPLHTPAVLHFYRAVVDHLSSDWESADAWTVTGIVK